MMKRFKLFFRFEKEEKWLEEMAEKGWLLSRTGFFYYFRKTKPKKRTIRIDCRTFRSKQDFFDYCSLFEDSGWKHIAGTKSSGAQYFVRKNPANTGENTSDGTTDGISDDIFSDSASKARRYQKLSELWLMVFILYLPILIQSGWPDFHYLFSPKEWYLTPGLWELKGLSFWCAFLFETPFALGRGLSWVLLCAGLAFCLFLSAKARILSRVRNRRSVT